MAIELPASIKTNDLLRQIEELNTIPMSTASCSSIPVPAHIDERAAFRHDQLSTKTSTALPASGLVE